MSAVTETSKDCEEKNDTDCEPVTEVSPDEDWESNEDSQDDGRVEVSTDQSLVLGEDGDDKRKLSLRGHREARDETVPQVQPLEPVCVVEVGRIIVRPVHENYEKVHVYKGQ